MNAPAAICLATSAYAVGCIPVLLLADAEHLTPRAVREAPATARAAAERAALTIAALLLILTAPTGATR
ncbi:hypothetical protein ACFWDZ_32865 [Micromonospora aurantiaca]|uniref:hypothetical protein n=1 Tax=Micromonospora aurantiaca (nom. illeg.) TaxID=47850 RepID=UPI00365B7C77